MQGLWHKSFIRILRDVNLRLPRYEGTFSNSKPNPNTKVSPRVALRRIRRFMMQVTVGAMTTARRVIPTLRRIMTTARGVMTTVRRVVTTVRRAHWSSIVNTHRALLLGLKLRSIPSTVFSY